ENALISLNEPKAIANVILTEVLRVLNEKSIAIKDFSITPNRLVELIKLKMSDKINSTAMQTIFNEMLSVDESPTALAEKLNLIQVSDTGFIEPIIDEVIASNPDEVKRYKEGKKALIGFFIGQIMKKSQGKANPKQVKELVLNRLESK
ncbi:MAG: Asp-tRNA(Asn)/Glu-tRNA(Gln) amidotransferase GatCAB subunit B, partial [Candidatus Paceibacterota bacterium]